MPSSVRSDKPLPGARHDPQRLVDTCVAYVKRSGFSDVTTYQLADAYIEPAMFASAIAPATGSQAAVADLNWKSGSDPALLAIAWNPFRSRFENGVLYRGSGLWEPDPSFTENGLTFFVNPSIVLKPPAGRGFGAGADPADPGSRRRTGSTFQAGACAEPTG
jgi:hypothetical protein